MADRFPLILNTSANQIQEIASGDTLDLTGSNVKGVGIITAANFSGNIIAGAGSSNIVAGIITATQIDLNGDIDVDGHTELDNVRVSGILTSNQIKLEDNKFLLLGTGNDLQLRHDGSHSYIQDTGTGNLYFTSNNFNFFSPTNEKFAVFNNNSSVELYWDNSKKFETTSTGITVTGTVVATGADINGDIDVDGHTNLDNVSVSGVSTFSNNVLLLDNDKVHFGDSQDLSIWHQGNSYIRSKTNDLVIYTENAGDLYFKVNNNETAIRADANGSVRLAYDNSTKLATTDTGINVTGDGVFSGNVSIGGTLTYEDVTNIDSVGIVTAREGVFIPDDKELKIGNTAGSPDTKIFHNGTKTRLVSSVQYDMDADVIDIHNAAANAMKARFLNSSVELYENNTKRFETTSIGAQVTATNNGDGLVVTAGEGGAVTVVDQRNAAYKGTLYMGGSAPVIRNHNTSTSDSTLLIQKGSTFIAKFDGNGHFLPFTDSQYNIGSSSLRFANIYTDAINVAGTATISGATNTVNITHTGGHGLSITRSNKSVAINANYGASNTHASVETTSGMDLRFYLGGGEKIRFESAGNIVPTTDSQITLGNSSKRFTALWADYVEANNFGSNGVYSGKFGRIRIGADVYGNTIKTESDNNLNITVPHSVYFNTSANANGSDAGTARLRIYDGGIVPSNDKAIDLGSTSIAWRNVYTDNIITTTALSNRNVIHNGTMFVAQRGTSQSGVNSSGYAKAADRWKLEANGSNVGTYTVSRSTDNPGGFGYSYKIQCTTAHSSLANNEMYEFVQYIEGRNVQRFNKGNSAAKPFALSFYVKTNKTGTYAVLLLDHQHSRMCCANYTVSNTGWNRYEIVFPADTTGSWSFSVNKRLSVKFCLLTGGLFQGGTLQTTWGAATNSNSRVGHNVNLADTVGNTFYITGIQLEAASACTPYEHKDYTDVLRECQRYLFTTHMLGAGVWNGGSSFFTAVRTPVPMRAHPTITTNSGGFGNINIENEDNYGINGLTNPSSGHGNPNSTAAQQNSGFSDFVVGLSVTYTQTTGYGGLVLCDAASDYFILDAQL